MTDRVGAQRSPGIVKQAVDDNIHSEQRRSPGIVKQAVDDNIHSEQRLRKLRAKSITCPAHKPAERGKEGAP